MVKRREKSAGGVTCNVAASIEASVAVPRLARKIREIVDPVLLLYAHRVDHVRQIVLGVGQDKCRVADIISAVGANRRFRGGREIRRDLGRVDGGLASREADEALIEVIKPGAQSRWGVALWIGGDEDHLELIRKVGRQRLQGVGHNQHLERTHVRAMGVSEEQQRDVTFGLRPKIERGPGGIAEGESRLGQGWRYDSAAIIRTGT